ncbi:MAG TPA: Ig-like domain-containing protein, partial [Candidatus Limnocylindria bacterium]|nr:Ig-like domain-containing protein [Candidatus Limnocylindria bacterium]
MVRVGTRIVVAALAAVLVGCGVADPPALPSTSPAAEATPTGPVLARRIEVEPSAVLLTGSGQTAQLTATATAADGTVPSVSWRSSDPASVSVDEGGKVTAITDLGSAVVFAEAGDRSTPVAVLIAEPAPHAVLVSDAQIVGSAQRLGDPNGPPANGDRYRVALTGIEAPATGTIVLATGSAEVAGRVVAATQAGETVDVEYELVPLPQLFARYSIDLDLPLDPRDAGLEPVARADLMASRSNPGRQGPTRVLADEVRAEKEAKFEKGPLT